MNLYIGLVSLALFAVPPAAQSPMAPVAPEDLAEKSALAWLALVDAGRYEESWKEAASLFRGAVSQEDWKKMMAGTRQPLGKTLSRKVKSRTYKENLPGAPDGKYVVLEFDTSFENKKTSVETVTPMQEEAAPSGSLATSSGSASSFRGARNRPTDGLPPPEARVPPEETGPGERCGPGC